MKNFLRIMVVAFTLLGAIDFVLFILSVKDGAIMPPISFGVSFLGCIFGACGAHRISEQIK